MATFGVNRPSPWKPLHLKETKPEEPSLQQKMASRLGVENDIEAISGALTINYTTTITEHPNSCKGVLFDPLDENCRDWCQTKRSCIRGVLQELKQTEPVKGKGRENVLWAWKEASFEKYYEVGFLSGTLEDYDSIKRFLFDASKVDFTPSIKGSDGPVYRITDKLDDLYQGKEVTLEQIRKVVMAEMKRDLSLQDSIRYTVCYTRTMEKVLTYVPET